MRCQLNKTFQRASNGFLSVRQEPIVRDIAGRTCVSYRFCIQLSSRLVGRPNKASACTLRWSECLYVSAHRGFRWVIDPYRAFIVSVFQRPVNRRNEAQKTTQRKRFGQVSVKNSSSSLPNNKRHLIFFVSPKQKRENNKSLTKTAFNCFVASQAEVVVECENDGRTCECVMTWW